MADTALEEKANVNMSPPENKSFEAQNDFPPIPLLANSLRIPVVAVSCAGETAARNRDAGRERRNAPREPCALQPRLYRSDACDLGRSHYCFLQPLHDFR